MLRSQPKNERDERKVSARMLLLATSIFAITTPVYLHAQETELRGEVSESAIQRDQQAKVRQLTAAQNASGTTPTVAAGLPTPAYVPANPGALPDNSDTSTATGSIFGNSEASQDDTADDLTTQRQRRSSTARTQTANRDDNTAPQDNAATATGASDQEEETTNRRASTVDSDNRLPLNPREERTGSIEGQSSEPETDPYAPLGVRVGSFTLRPTIEQGITATSNADSSSNGQSAILSETTLRFNAASDWRENSASINGYGIVRKTLSGEEVSDARGRIDGTLNIDLGNELRAIGKLGYEAAPESASSPVVITGTASQPLRQTIDGSLGIEKDVGKMRFGLTGAAAHDSYGDADLSTGATLSQEDRNSTLYTATLRSGYEISPAITPFVEFEGGRRLYDQRADSSGYQRSSTRLGARGGVELDLGEKLAGEFSAGWLRESFDDDRLAPISGATLNADLRWSPQRGTTIGIRGTTELEGTTTAGESGSVLYSGRITAERQIRANLTGTAALGLDWRNYSGSSGHDLIFSAEAGLTWWLNRYAGITTRVRHETLASNLAGRDSKTNSVYLGVTLQR